MMQHKKPKIRPNQSISIFILGEYALVRQGLAFTLATDFEVIGQSEINGVSIKTIARKKPNLILLNIRVIDALVVETIEKLTSGSILSKIIILSPEMTKAIRSRMMNLGVAGILTKDISLFDLKQAFHTIVHCNFFVSSRSMVELKDEEQLSHPSHQFLSRYETNLIKFISKGMTSKEIGQCLNVSSRVIDTQRHKLLRKLDARNSAELVRFASPNATTLKD